MPSQPIHQATGTLMAQNATKDSPTTYTGSLRTRSSQTPEGRLKIRNGLSSMAVSSPICVGVAFSSTAAVSGSTCSLQHNNLRYYILYTMAAVPPLNDVGRH